MTISSKFWLIGYIHIGFSYLREKIATSGHSFHFYRTITTHCGQDMAKAFFGQILHYPHISKIFPKGKIRSQHFVKVIWRITVERTKLVGRDIDIIGHENVSSTNGVRIDLVENANTHKHLQSLMAFASSKLNWFHQTPGMFSIIIFWLRCRVHPKNDISTWIHLSFPFLDQ